MNPTRLLLCAVLAGCGGAPANPAKAETKSADAKSVAPKIEKAEPAPAAKPSAPKPVVTWGGFSTPESVLYDVETDRIVVSNVNGKPFEADNNGFISEIGPDGTVKQLKWIEGGTKTKLNAPKGMAIANGVLYVADIDRVRMFDAKSGSGKGEVAIAGASFLNDVAVAPDGRVFVTDTGVKGADFAPTGTDAVWVIEKGKAKALAKSKDLNRPNGLLWSERGLLVNTFGAAEVFLLDDKGARHDVTHTPKGGLDGLAMVGDTLLVTSWEGEAIYRGKLGGSFEPWIEKLSAPADIGYDSKRKRVLVPRFLDDKVEAFELP